jgi:hypothetical protein
LDQDVREREKDREHEKQMADKDKNHEMQMAEREKTKEIEREEVKATGGKAFVDKIGKAIERLKLDVETVNTALQKNTEVLADTVEAMTIPKKIVFDKDGMPVGIEPSRKLN